MSQKINSNKLLMLVGLGLVYNSFGRRNISLEY